MNNKKSTLIFFSLLVLLLFGWQKLSCGAQTLSQAPKNNIKDNQQINKSINYQKVAKIKKSVSPNKTLLPKTYNKTAKVNIENSVDSLPKVSQNLGLLSPVKPLLPIPPTPPTLNALKPSAISQIKAKNTAGHYIIADYINSEISYDEFWILKKSDYENYPNLPNYGYTGIKSPTKNKNSFGFRYGYAINYHDVFIMPELFYNNINIKVKFEQNLTENYTNPLGQFNDWSAENGYGFKNLKIHNMLGLKLNLGYDFNSYFSLYGLAGFAKIKISNTSGIYNPWTLKVLNENRDLNPHISKNKIEPFYGFGLKLKLSQNLNLFTEYQRFDIKVATATKNLHNIKRFEYGSFINGKLIITKIGLGYNF